MGKCENVNVETTGIAVSVDSGMLRASSSWNPSDFGIADEKIPACATTGGRKLWDNWIPYRFRQLRDNANYLISKMSYRVGKLYFVPESVALQCLAELQVFEDQYYAHKRYVIDNLQELSSCWMAGHSDLHLNVSDYPTASHLEEHLRFTVDYHMISFPDDKVFDRMEAAAAEEIMKENQSQMLKIRKEMQEKATVFMKNCTGQLLEEAMNVTSKLHIQLKKKKKLHQGTVKSFHDFFERFRLLNISGDKNLDSLLVAIRSELIACDGVNYTDASMDTEKRLSDALKKVLELGVESVSGEAEELLADVEASPVKVTPVADVVSSSDTNMVFSGRFMGGRV